MARPTSIYDGERYGRWVVLALSGVNKRRRSVYLCRCDCGTERSVSGGNLKNGTSRSCGCASGGIKLEPYRGLYNRFAKDAERYGRTVQITFEEFVSFTRTTECHYCGAPIYWRKFGCGKTSAYNLDRKHNEQTYSMDTVVVCCCRCNRSKSNSFTYEEWIQIGKLIRSWPEHDRDINAARNTLLAAVGLTVGTETSAA